MVSNSDTLRVEVTGADGKAFLAGTVIRKPKASDVGVDHEQLIQKPGTELVAVIGGEARVVEVNDDTMIIQQREVVSRMMKDDPFLVLFEWFRLPERSAMDTQSNQDNAWSVTGTIHS